MSSEYSENRNTETTNEFNLNNNISNKESDIVLLNSKGEIIDDNDMSGTKLIQEFLQISKNFLEIKKVLKSYKNQLLEFIFEKIGYKYQGYIHQPNFFHLSAEAYILGIFQELKKEIKERDINDLTINNLLNIISQLIVKENVFIENMEILIGKLSYLESFMNEEKIFRSILIDLNSSKNEILKDEKILKNIMLTKQNLFEIFERIFQTSFNIFLNNINSAEEKKKNLLLFDIFKNLKRENQISFENFEKEYCKEKNIHEIYSDNLKHQLLEFYEFSSIHFEDLISDINLFNNNSTSLIYKIYSILAIIHIPDCIQEKIDFNKTMSLMENYCNFKEFKNFILKYIINNYFRLEKARKFIEIYYDNCKTKFTQIYKNQIYLRTDKMKQWINSMEIINNSKMIPLNCYNLTKEYFKGKNSFRFNKINDYMYLPIKESLLQIKEKGMNYVIYLKEKNIEKIFYFQRFIFEFVAKNFQFLKNYVGGNHSLFKITNKNEEGYFSIQISKELFFLNPNIFCEFFTYVKEFLTKFYKVEFIKESFNSIKNNFIPYFKNKVIKEN